MADFSYPWGVLILSNQVGSSLELQQRLDEPIPLPSTSSVSISMHIFDINTQANGALDVWRKIATLPSDKLQTRTGAGGEWWRDSITDLEAKRQRYFEATQPPQPVKEHGSTQFTRVRLLYPDLEPALNPKKDAILREAPPVSLNQSNFTQTKEGFDSILTNEGRKQVSHLTYQSTCYIQSHVSFRPLST